MLSVFPSVVLFSGGPPLTQNCRGSWLKHCLITVEKQQKLCPHMGSQCFLAILLPLYCCSSGFSYDLDAISVTSDITPSWQSFQFFGILSTRRANLKFSKCIWFFFFNICVPLNLAFPNMVHELTALALSGGSLECKVSLSSLLNQDLHFNKIHG